MKVFNTLFVEEKKLLLFENKKTLDELRKLAGSYSQEGEDLVLHRLLKDVEKGFYVDVGAHHPFRFSNTYKMHKRGWTGINIDIVPDVIEKFKLERPNDININIGISNVASKKDVFVFKERALSTVNKEIAENLVDNTNYDIDFILKDVPLMSLNDILKDHNTQKIDFLNIDAEGEDFNIVSSFNWSKYAPSVVCVECRGGELENFHENEVWKLLSSNNYRLFSKLYNSWIFVKKH